MGYIDLVIRHDINVNITCYDLFLVNNKHFVHYSEPLCLQGMWWWIDVMTSIKSQVYIIFKQTKCRYFKAGSKNDELLSILAF